MNTENTETSDYAGCYAPELRRDRERAALEVLRSTGVDVLEAALVAKEALECGRGRVRRARECVRLGAEEMRKREKTVTFRKAVEMALEEREKKNRRARTVTDFRYYCKRLMVRNPGLSERRMRSITSDDCRAYLQTAYGESPSQYRKARAILSGVFSTAIRHDWCDSNPVSRVEVPDVVEKPIEPLTIEEVERLEAAAQMPEHQDMQLSLHLMLYCGIRPTEVSRIDPERDIDWQNQRVVVRPTTSKTGGGRVVPLRKADAITVRTIPHRWIHRWRALRKAAGWGKETAHPWRQDVCRHTFATYHAARFRNFAALQMEMGHRDSSLLHTRYVYAGNGTEATALRYFRV
ncbi:MAG: tyrosine-type recombinase/integrase [Akkermansia sp.]|nr:tyrosine-type recombinase/integrase [Akkermansia sp.]